MRKILLATALVTALVDGHVTADVAGFDAARHLAGGGALGGARHFAGGLARLRADGLRHANGVRDLAHLGDGLHGLDFLLLHDSLGAGDLDGSLNGLAGRDLRLDPSRLAALYLLADDLLSGGRHLARDLDRLRARHLALEVFLAVASLHFRAAGDAAVTAGASATGEEAADLVLDAHVASAVSHAALVVLGARLVALLDTAVLLHAAREVAAGDGGGRDGRAAVLFTVHLE